MIDCSVTWKFTANASTAVIAVLQKEEVMLRAAKYPCPNARASARSAGLTLAKAPQV